MRTKYQALLIKKSDAKVQIKFKMGLKNWDKIYPPNSTLLSRQDRIKKGSELSQRETFTTN